MKAERRHDLKTNALARGLEGFPDYWREYGNKALLVVIVALLSYLGVKYWKDKKVRDAENLASSLQTIRQDFGELDQLDRSSMTGDPATLADSRQRISRSADEAISTLLTTAKDPQTIARAYAAQGDLNWKLANMPDPIGASTRPELRIQNRDTLLNDARDAYSKTLDPQYNAAALDVFDARIGLAVICENQHLWNQAAQQYQALADDAKMPPAFKEYAQTRLKQMPEYEKGALVAAMPDVPVAPQQPAILGPEAPPTSQPAAASMPAIMPPAPSTQQSLQPPQTQPK